MLLWEPGGPLVWLWFDIQLICFSETWAKRGETGAGEEAHAEKSGKIWKYMEVCVVMFWQTYMPAFTPAAHPDFMLNCYEFPRWHFPRKTQIVLNFPFMEIANCWLISVYRCFPHSEIQKQPQGLCSEPLEAVSARCTWFSTRKTKIARRFLFIEIAKCWLISAPNHPWHSDSKKQPRTLCLRPLNLISGQCTQFQCTCFALSYISREC